MGKKNCPYCGSNNTKKKGLYNMQRQRYRCKLCGRQFQNHPQQERLERALWDEYVYQRQTIRQLSEKHRRGKDWIRECMRNASSRTHYHTPQSVVVIADVTFFKRSFGILVVQAPHLKKNLYVREVQSESVDVYRQGRTTLEKKGYTLKAIVLDGRPGFRQLFADIPVQMCHFHQKKIITRYLTNNPKQRQALS
jgi:hypothetical protein